MASYSSEDALKELKEIESKFLYKTENFVRDKNPEAIARILLAIDNELFETESEARRLRLSGQLDVNVYRTLIDGYFGLQRQVIELSEKYGLGRDVRDKYSFLMVEVSLAKRKEAYT